MTEAHPIMTSRDDDERQDHDVILREIVEDARVLRHITIRDAAYRAGMSEGNWRQLVSSRPPTRMQLLDMARAVGVFDKVAERIDATPEEIEASDVRLGHVMDLAERELLHARHLNSKEKQHLIDCLQQFREEKYK